jgi:hypothetical protein
MFGRQRGAEIAARRKARRDREDGSARLRDEVPALSALHFEVSSRHGRAQLAETRHLKRFVVDQAPALFEMPCTDKACKDGGHDLTREVLKALRAAAERFEVEDDCRAGCGRTLQVVGVAAYR